MNGKKVGISTLFTGYNFGSTLQAFAMKEIVKNHGYDAVLLKIRGSLVKGRDVRLKKLLIIFLRSLIHWNEMNDLKKYKDSLAKVMTSETINKFDTFIADELSPQYVSYSQLKKYACSDSFVSFVCGSDQVWDASAAYVDPFYYLRFAPIRKRIAFATSFGSDHVPNYNKKKLIKYLSEIKYKTVRETSGAQIIKQLTGENIEVLFDPTLVLSPDEWIKALKLAEKKEKEKYLLAYFLDIPSQKAIEIINEIAHKYKYKIIALPYMFDELQPNTYTKAGPIEFVQFIKNADFVCTDSFHGTAFALNFNIPFYTFERGSVSKNQSTRIISLLTNVHMMHRYEPDVITDCYDISFSNSNRVLSVERKKALAYINNCLHLCDYRN